VRERKGRAMLLPIYISAGNAIDADDGADCRRGRSEVGDEPGADDARSRRVREPSA